MKPHVLHLLVLLTLISCSQQKEPASERSIKEPDSKVDPVVDQELLALMIQKDSLLFQVGFNQIDTSQVAQLIAEDFEFYHDEHGITDSKIAFVNSIAGLKELPFKTWRELEKGSMEIFPMYRNNKQELYGVIQTGVHIFYQQQDGEEAHKSSTAKFTHLWILENDEFKLKRVLSYNHQ